MNFKGFLGSLKALVVLEEVLWFLRRIQESLGCPCGLQEVQFVLEAVSRVLDEVQEVLLMEVKVILVVLVEDNLGALREVQKV